MLIRYVCDHLSTKWGVMPRIVRAFGPAPANAAHRMPVDPSRMRGLGDLVARIAEPIAGAIDAVAGTQIKGCGGCARRREKLNSAVPFTKSPD